MVISLGRRRWLQRPGVIGPERRLFTAQSTGGAGGLFQRRRGRNGQDVIAKLSWFLINLNGHVLSAARRISETLRRTGVPGLPLDWLPATDGSRVLFCFGAQ
jgi:hypothetical protein